MKYEQIKNLPEYANQYVEKCDLTKVDDVKDGNFVTDDVLVSQILSVNPETGFPNNDIDILESTTNVEVREYLLRCIKRLRPVPTDGLSDEDLQSLHFSRFDDGETYIQRLKNIAESVDVEPVKDS